MDSFKNFLKKEEEYLEFFNIFNSKKLTLNLNNFQISDETKILDKTLMDFLKEKNPILSFENFLKENKAGFNSFTPEDLQFIIITFLKKISYFKIFEFIPQKTLIAVSESKDFIKNIIENLNNFYAGNNNSSILAFIDDFLLEFQSANITGADIEKIIINLKNEELIKQVLEKFIKHDIFKNLNMDNLFYIINNKNASTKLIEFLLKEFVSNKFLNDKEISIIQNFINIYNKNNPKKKINLLNLDDLRIVPFRRKRELEASDFLKSIAKRVFKSGFK